MAPSPRRGPDNRRSAPASRRLYLGWPLSGQPALADARLARNEYDRRSAVRGDAHGLIEGGQLGRPADQRSVPRPPGHGVIIALWRLAPRRELRDRSDGTESVGQPMTNGGFAQLADLLAEDHTVVSRTPMKSSRIDSVLPI
jgi:hypothetical protein